MTVHFYAKGDLTSATARFRCYLLAEQLQARGLRVRVHEPLKRGVAVNQFVKHLLEVWINVQSLRSVHQHDVIYLVRTVYQFGFFLSVLGAKVFFRRKIIFDFDDPIYLRPALRRRMILLTKLADGVVVGSHELAQWARVHNKQVTIVPTSIPFATYSRFSRERRQGDQKFTLGWIGFGANHRENLRMLVPVFERLVALGVEFRFMLIGAQHDQGVHELFRGVMGLNVEFIDEIPWAEVESSPREIQKFDVGLMPLQDSEWNRAKCAFKAIEYMACAVPAVVSPVGESTHLIQDGVNGCWADSAEAWVEKIKLLYHDRELLERIGRAGQQTILESYSLEANAPKVMKILKQL